MKKTFTVLSFFFLSFSLYSQTYVDGVPLDKLFSGKYIEVCYFCRGFNQFYAMVDFGQAKPRKPFEPNAHYFSDEFGERIRFNSEMGILNFMDENGFDVFHKSDTTACVIYTRRE